MYSSLDTRPENRTLLWDTTRLSQMSDDPQGESSPGQALQEIRGL